MNYPAVCSQNWIRSGATLRNGELAAVRFRKDGAGRRRYKSRSRQQRSLRTGFGHSVLEVTTLGEHCGLVKVVADPGFGCHGEGASAAEKVYAVWRQE